MEKKKEKVGVKKEGKKQKGRLGKKYNDKRGSEWMVGKGKKK